MLESETASTENAEDVDERKIYCNLDGYYDNYHVPRDGDGVENYRLYRVRDGEVVESKSHYQIDWDQFDYDVIDRSELPEAIRSHWSFRKTKKVR